MIRVKCQKKYEEIVVIGGGAAGLMAAGCARSAGAKVSLIEKNNILGRKLLITGKGRCNVTNNADISDFFPNVIRNSNFLYSAFYTFSNEDLIRFFEERGVLLKTERGGRVFPRSDKSADILEALKAYIRGVNVIREESMGILIDNGSIKGVKLKGGDISCDKVILACGGKSYPQTGSTGDGYRIAKEAGHAITDLKPALVPLTVKEGYTEELAGLSLKNIGIQIKNRDGKIIYKDFGEMLFTHHGVSGPIIISASAYIGDESGYTLHIDLKPALSKEKLDARILRDFKKYQNRDIQNGLCDLLPKRLIPVVIGISGIDPTLKINCVTRDMRKALVEALKDFSFYITGKGSFSEAIITDGGIDVKEINPSTMESRLISGLYFAGEIIDCHAYTGGYNLQIAFSTGYLAGLSAAQKGGRI